MKRWGNYRTNSAIVSLLMTHLPGRRQAQSMTRSTPALSIISTSCAALRSWPNKWADPDCSKSRTTSGIRPSLKTGCAHASMICPLEVFAIDLAPLSKNEQKLVHCLFFSQCSKKDTQKEHCWLTH